MANQDLEVKLGHRFGHKNRKPLSMKEVFRILVTQGGFEPPTLRAEI